MPLIFTCLTLIDAWSTLYDNYSNIGYLELTKGTLLSLRTNKALDETSIDNEFKTLAMPPDNSTLAVVSSTLIAIHPSDVQVTQNNNNSNNNNNNNDNNGCDVSIDVSV